MKKSDFQGFQKKFPFEEEQATPPNGTFFWTPGMMKIKWNELIYGNK